VSRDVLNLWLHGQHLGEIEQLRNGRSRLRFADEATARWGMGTHLLSFSLPLTSRRVESQALEDYLDNLLPEGAVRVQLEQRHRVRPGDTFGLLRHIGAECAGAIQLAAADEPPTGHLVPLSDAEVDRIVLELPTLTAPAGEEVTASLGGVQSKVLLTRAEQGWAWPASGAVSTHIVKPEPSDPQTAIPTIVEWEHWTMQLARAAGLPAASSELVRFADRLALVVERYDRVAGRRLHQEDFAQALGIRPGGKYEPADQQASRLSRIAAGPGSEAHDPAGFRRELLQLVTFNVIVGNGDAHAKNYSMIITDGLFSLAPAYDTAPVFCLNDRFSNFGMRLAGQRSLKYLTGQHLVDEATSWGLGERAARDVIAETAESVRDALRSAPAEPSDHDVSGRIERRAIELADS
jgi:serine/threonine-protein kinase HipA